MAASCAQSMPLGFSWRKKNVRLNYLENDFMPNHEVRIRWPFRVSPAKSCGQSCDPLHELMAMAALERSFIIIGMRLADDR